MRAFPLTKAPTLAGYVSVLRQIGAPVDAGLRRARLPTLFEEFPDSWMSYERLRIFTADMARREGIPDLGLIPQAADMQQSLSRSFREPVLSAPTLFRALQRIPSLTSRQTTDIRFWVEPAGDQVRVCLVLPLPLDVPGYSIGETRTLGLIANIIGAFVGSSFAPTRVLLASRAGDLHFDLDAAYGGVPVHTDQPYGAIEFPRTLLSSARPAARDHLGHPGSTPPANPPAETLACALQACLAPYLLEGYPSVDLAAEIAGLSVRTLQRRLREEGESYMGLIDKVRCEAALSSLRDESLSLRETGQRLGYSDQAAFTRAFQRWTGTTPGEYRARTHTSE